jgi:lipid-A-disaccharide synthase-like uncharacterized protein
MKDLLSLDVWIVIGYLGQLVFASRFAVQWAASEMRKKSLIPVAFWWLSLAGSLLLLTYAVAKGAGPIVVGQMFGFVVYSRNLWLIRQERLREAQSA